MSSFVILGPFVGLDEDLGEELPDDGELLEHAEREDLDRVDVGIAVDDQGEEVDWVPGKTNLPFGPWLAAGALEILFFSDWLSKHLAPAGVGWFFGA